MTVMHAARHHALQQRATFAFERHNTNDSRIFAPERSGGASYSESGVSNDQVSVRPLFDVDEKAEIPRMVSAPVTVSIYNGDFFSRFSRCRRKVRLRGEGMICRDPKKVDFFQNLNHSNYAYIRRPRTIRSSLQPS